MIEEYSERGEKNDGFYCDIDGSSLDEGVGDIVCDEANNVHVPQKIKLTKVKLVPK